MESISEKQIISILRATQAVPPHIMSKIHMLGSTNSDRPFSEILSSANLIDSEITHKMQEFITALKTSFQKTKVEEKDTFSLFSLSLEQKKIFFLQRRQ